MVAAIIRLNSLRRASMSGNSPRRHFPRRATTYSLARSAPASDRMSASSSSVRTCSSTGPIPRAIASTFIRRSSRVFDNPVLSRERKDPAGLSSCEGMRTRLKRGASGLEFHRNHLGDARFFHGDPVQYVGELHRPLVVRDEKELVIRRHLPDDRVEPVDVGVVQGSIRLVEQAERGGFDKEDREDEADGGQRLLPAGEKVQGLELLARRLRHDLHARFQEVPLVEQLQGSPSPQEQLGENLLKLPVDAVERRGEPVPRGPVDPLNGLGEVLEGFLEVLFLRQEEGVPFGKLLVLLEGGKVHLADGGHARPHLAGPGFPAGQIAVLFHPGPSPLAGPQDAGPKAGRFRRPRADASPSGFPPSTRAAQRVPRFPGGAARFPPASPPCRRLRPRSRSCPPPRPGRARRPSLRTLRCASCVPRPWHACPPATPAGPRAGPPRTGTSPRARSTRSPQHGVSFESPPSRPASPPPERRASGRGPLLRPVRGRTASRLPPKRFVPMSSAPVRPRGISSRGRATQG